MIRLADYVVQRLVAHGVRDIFLVTGGGAMHLNDAIAREPRLRYFCNHHEQASAMAAEGYARVTGKLGVLNVTAGPAGSTRSTACSAPSPTPSPCSSSPARPSAKRFSPPTICPTCASSATRKSTSSTPPGR